MGRVEEETNSVGTAGKKRAYMVVYITYDTIIDWKLRNVKPGGINLGRYFAFAYKKAS